MKKQIINLSMFFLTAFSGMLFETAVTAQDKSAPNPASPAAVSPAPAASRTSAASPASARTTRVPQRKLAPHVFTKIDPHLDKIFMVNTFALQDSGKKDLEFTWAKNQPFYNDVWYFDFEIKSLRTIVLPSAITVDGEKKAVLKKYMYLMYRIKNPGRYFTVKEVQTVNGVTELKDRQEEVFGKYHEDANALRDSVKTITSEMGDLPVTELSPVEQMPMSFELIVKEDKSLEFTPMFELRLEDEQQLNREERRIQLVRKRLGDEYNPFVVKKIAEKERPAGKLYGSCDFIGKKIKPGEEVWGVAIWSDTNYSADRFSIVINGLTNVRKYNADEGKYTYKNLKLNYWHPGELNIFRLGQPGGLDFEWIFE